MKKYVKGSAQQDIAAEMLEWLDEWALQLIEDEELDNPEDCHNAITDLMESSFVYDKHYPLSDVRMAMESPEVQNYIGDLLYDILAVDGYSNRNIPTKELSRFGDKIASIVRSRTGVQIRCTDAYVVDYNRLCLDFDDWDTGTPYSICIGLDPDATGIKYGDLIDSYLDIAVDELINEVS